MLYDTQHVANTVLRDRKADWNEESEKQEMRPKKSGRFVVMKVSRGS